jgi:anti-repressor protein
MKHVFIQHNRPVTDSLLVAETFGKRHDNVIRDIKELECSSEFSLLNFEESSYTAGNGQSYTKYLITQDGFAFLVMGYTGKEAARFKEMYITEFNRMRDELNKPQIALPQTYKEALVALLSKVEENEHLQHKIETDRPKVLFADSVEVSKDSILVSDMAKMLRQNGIMIGGIRLFQWLRENGYLVKSGSDYNMPTQRSMELQLFEVKVGSRNGSDGSVKITRTPKVTGKGQIYFINKFKSKSAS